MDDRVEKVFRDAARVLAPPARPAVRDDAAADLLRDEVRRLARRIGLLERAFAELSRRRDPPPGLGLLLARIHRFALSTAWTCRELVEDSRRSAPDLWLQLDQATGGRGTPAVRLGILLRRYEGIAVDGLRLERVRVELGVWTYRVVAEPLATPFAA